MQGHMSFGKEMHQHLCMTSVCTLGVVINSAMVSMISHEYCQLFLLISVCMQGLAYANELLVMHTRCVAAGVNY